MKRILTTLFALAIVLAGSMSALAAEMDTGTGQDTSYYPISVEEYTYGETEEPRINKVYQLSLSDDPSGIPILIAPEPEECVVCDNLQGPRFHAPCLLELSTGELTELEIYEPCHRYSGELAPDQDMDYNVMTFGGSGLPLFIDRMEEIQRCVAYLPEKAGGEIEPSYYCRDCRAKLTKVATQGYVLLDLYDLDAIQAYPVEDGAEYPIRIYTVTMAHDEDQGHLVVTNIGHLFES